MRKNKEQNKEELLNERDVQSIDNEAKAGSDISENPNAIPDKDAEFEKLINGEFKEQFEQKMAELVNQQRKNAAMEETVRSWARDGEYLKEKYPSFSLDAEVANPAFLRLLKGGADLKSAYLALHHDEIVKDMMEKAARDAQNDAAQSLRMNRERPLENGMAGKSTALFKTDVSALTPEQRAELAKRAARGETISF